MGKRVKIVRIGEDVELPLVGAIAFGVVDRGTNVLQIRPVSFCPLSCIFCSTDAGPKTRYRNAEYIVSLDLMIEWVKAIVKFKGERHIEAHIDTVGEPLTYPRVVELVQALSEIKGIEVISMQSNGVLLSEKLLDKLANAGLSRINLSIHSLNSEKSKFLVGVEKYDLNHVTHMAEYIANSPVDLLIAPVWIPTLNDKDISELINYAIKIGAGKRWPPLGLQKYIPHKRVRKPDVIKSMSWRKFYSALRELEKKFNVKLVLKPRDFAIHERRMLPIKFKKFEKIKVKVLAEGWLKGEKIGSADGRAVTLVNAEKIPLGSKVKAVIIRNKHNIYLAKPII